MLDPAVLRSAIFSYNHSDAYVTTVLSWAAKYGADSTLGSPYPQLSTLTQAAPSSTPPPAGAGIATTTTAA